MKKDRMHKYEIPKLFRINELNVVQGGSCNFGSGVGGTGIVKCLHGGSASPCTNGSSAIASCVTGPAFKLL